MTMNWKRILPAALLLLGACAAGDQDPGEDGVVYQDEDTLIIEGTLPEAAATEGDEGVPAQPVVQDLGAEVVGKSTLQKRWFECSVTQNNEGVSQDSPNF